MDISSGIPIHKTICLSPSQEIKTQARGTEWVKPSYTFTILVTVELRFTPIDQILMQQRDT